MKGLDAKPVRIEGDDGEWIEIKASLSMGDKDWIDNQLMNLELGDQGVSGKYRLGRETMLLERAIIGWELKTDDGRPYPFERSRIAKLPLGDPLVEQVLGEIVDRNPTLSQPSVLTQESESDAG